MLSEVDFLCVDCNVPVRNLRYKHSKSIVQRCVDCYRHYCYGECEYVGRKGYKCPFKPGSRYDHYCEKHEHLAPSCGGESYKRSRHKDPFEDADFGFGFGSSTSSSSSPPRSRTKSSSKSRRDEQVQEVSESMKLLGLDHTQPISMISCVLLKKLYRQKALELHPDKNLDRDTTIEFQKLGEAYETLKLYAART